MEVFNKYVDQRTSDKIYILKATLPADSDLKTAAKSWFADVILSPEGDVLYEAELSQKEEEFLGLK